ncbi:TetR family transcriptional regulator [Lactococcus hodotermopsidis]|uniref:TetR family transcriptional regulator n=1 Tax=Pseudolactococcus hodotermopsidis TaxID=2709157 RepID=A0A6A0BC01_9LACT|nr:TetR/AcrR family transcriptional regulator [Lactococcus hodotermopsidis]GFH42366.1 TetR family transcriptional regulator [Lactococcus hodotermopsidis]
MARKKTIFKKDILKGAEKFILEKSPSELTARALSKYLNMSTQPLYAEFENMADLKSELFSQIYYRLQNQIFNKKTHDDPIINLCLNYINFAQENPKLFRTIYLEKHGNDDHSINEFSYNIFRSIIKDNPIYSQLSEKKINNLLTGTWVVSTGFANLIASETIKPNQFEIVSFLEDTIQDTLKMKSIKV